MADHLKPTLTSNYSSFVTELDGRFDDLAVGLDPAVTTATNVPTNSIRWSSAVNKWQKYNGTSWADLTTTYGISISGNSATVTNGVYTTGSYANPTWITSLAGSKITGDIAGNAGSATKLATARNINGVAFDGTAAISINLNNSVTFNNGGAGSASGATFNGGSAVTISYNTVGAPSTTGTNASGTWGINISGNAATASDIGTAALSRIYPIGSIYINATNSANPSTLLGFGTWVAFGAGRVMVGFDSSDTLFNAAEKTGGSKDSTLVSHSHTFSATTSTDGSHFHGFTNFLAPDNVGGGKAAITNFDNAGDSTYVTDTAGGHSHSISGTTSVIGSSATNTNVQPYITVYMWKRTA